MTESSTDVPLEEQFFPTNAARLNRWCPWLRLGRGFALALDYRKMFLALLAVVVWTAGDRALSRIGEAVGSEDGPVSAAHALWPWEPEALPPVPATRTRVEFAEVFRAPLGSLEAAFSNGRVILWPWERLFTSAQGLVSRRDSIADWFGTWTHVVWGLLVTAFFGGAIGRLTALEFSGRGGASLRHALSYARSHLLSFVGAPLITVVGLALCWIPNLLAGLLAQIPILGDALLGVFWFLPVLFGFLMALVVVGLVAGWPLMYSAVSTEGSDAFDGLSRAYSYLFNRPWYALFLAIAAMLYGSVLLYFVCGMISLSIDLTAASIETGMGSVQDERLFSESPDHPLWAPWKSSNYSDERPLGYYGRQAIGVWMKLVASLSPAFIFSYFWTQATIIYFLLRRREDGTMLDEVHAEEPHPPGREIPVVGIPAATFREQQNPAP